MNGVADVVLVGCGFTGTSAFFQLVDRFPVDTITIFEASGDFGPGYPYRTDECPDYLINNATDTMCLAPANRRAFLEWLGSRPQWAAGLDGRGHLPRSVFGEFLRDTFAVTRQRAAAKGIEVTLIPREATSIRETSDDRVHVSWGGGEAVADAAILTTGRCPDKDDYPHPPPGSPARYFATQVMSPELDSLPNDATVHVLGASLSAYDVVNRLFSPASGCRFERSADGRLCFEAAGNNRRVVLCSRSGRLKAAQSRRAMALHRRRFTAAALRERAASEGLRLADVGSLLREEAADHAACVEWDAVVDPYRSCSSAAELNERARKWLQDAIDAACDGRRNFLVDLYDDAQLEVWDAFAERMLEAEEESLYRRRFETAVLSYAAPCPIPTAEKLLALHRAGRLAIVKSVRDTRLVDDGSAYRIAHEFGTDIAEVLVNATGTTERDVRSAAQPALIRGLVESGLLEPYRRDGEPMPGAAIDMDTFRPPGMRNTYFANMLLWGPGFFTSSAFMMATVVERILEIIFNRTSPEREGSC